MGQHLPHHAPGLEFIGYHVMYCAFKRIRRHAQVIVISSAENKENTVRLCYSFASADIIIKSDYLRSCFSIVWKKQRHISIRNESRNKRIAGESHSCLYRLFTNPFHDSIIYDFLVFKFRVYTIYSRNLFIITQIKHRKDKWGSYANNSRLAYTQQILKSHWKGP